MAYLFLWTVFIACWATMLRSQWRFSLGFLALVGLTVYSIPVLIGWSLPVQFSGNEGLVRTTTAGTFAMAVAWGAVLVQVLLTSRGRRTAASRSFMPVSSNYALCMLYALLALSILTMMAIVILDGPLFFLAERSGALSNSGPLFLIMRWAFLLGLILALYLKKKKVGLIFAGIIVIVFITGDRTLITISVCALGIASLYGQRVSLERIFSRYGLIAAAGIVILFYGKALYIAIKDPALTFSDTFGSLGSENWYDVLIIEPFPIHYLLESVIASNLTISAGDFFLPIVAQLLIIPSAFGVDSQSYNVLLTERLFRGVSYGLAYNPWAQAYSLFGYGGIFIFAFSYIAVIRFLDHVAMSKGLVIKVIAICVGSIIAVYFHRNSVENTLVFVRQVAIVLVLASIGAFLIQGMVRNRMSRPTSRRTP